MVFLVLALIDSSNWKHSCEDAAGEAGMGAGVLLGGVAAAV